MLVLLGCLHMAGGPYSLIQLYAWANMLVSYSQDTGILQATRDTFGGEKPCRLCERIAAAKESGEDRQAPALPGSKLSPKILHEIIQAQVVDISPPPALEWIPAAFAPWYGGDGIGADAPPTPPPLGVA